MDRDNICIINARVNNLKNLNIKIPREKLVVITGPSGSGKSSLAFDTIFKEGQRRYLESLTSFGKSFLAQQDKIAVDSITGLSPTLSLDQKTTSANKRSTVGTITEISDYLRLLFSQCATAHSPDTGLPIQGRDPEEIIKEIISLPNNSKIAILAPILSQQKGAHKDLLSKEESLGFINFRINNKYFDVNSLPNIKKNDLSSIDVVVDRVLISKEKKDRIRQSILTALKKSKGRVLIHLLDESRDLFFSQHFYCASKKMSYPEPYPNLFSSNSPRGQCSNCKGLGEISYIDKNKIFDAKTNSLLEQYSLEAIFSSDESLLNKLHSIFKNLKFSIEMPLKDLPTEFLDFILLGGEFKKANFLGLYPYLKKCLTDEDLNTSETILLPFISSEVCNSCNGSRLNPYASAFLFDNKSFNDFSNLSLSELHTYFKNYKKIILSGVKSVVEDKLTAEIHSRLNFLVNLGLSYLSLNRPANTLSGGELQRIRLASQLGSQLSGVVYVLDEPSIGLHPRDNILLINTLIGLRDLGNSILVVEHDEETIRHADHIIEIGPKSGAFGGELVVEGRYDDISHLPSSTTDYLTKRKCIEIPIDRRKINNWIELFNISKNNLNDLEVKIPLEVFCCITGVSGSGKSTLIHHVLTDLLNKLLRMKMSNLKQIKISKEKIIHDYILVDQKQIGRNSKSIVLSYCGLLDLIRKLFANTVQSKLHGLTTSHFSFNTELGRCEQCKGYGEIFYEMIYLSESSVQCPYCQGKRFKDSTLRIRYRGLSINDILNLSIEEALQFFAHHPKISSTLRYLSDVGLSYLKLGQSTPTLSGGEAQRLKLSRELSKIKKGKILYILDEPTTGLHFADIKLLLKSLNSLIEHGHSVIVIEHNLDLIKVADYVIDLGPEGGKKGGKIIAVGTPEKIIQSKTSLTGKYLKNTMLD